MNLDQFLTILDSVGSLAAGVGGSMQILNIVLGVFVVVVGLAHFLLACFFRNSLAPSEGPKFTNRNFSWPICVHCSLR